MKLPKQLFLLTIMCVTPSVTDGGHLDAQELERQLNKLPVPLFKADVMETTPVLWKGREILFCSMRPAVAKHEPEQLRLSLYDPAGKQEIASFGVGHSLGCAFVEGDTIHVYAAVQPSANSWFTDINHFFSTDLKEWKMEPCLRAERENLLNSSVCRDKNGYLMVYESNSPVAFCCKFARSQDLSRWEKIPDIVFAGKDGKTYSACPVIRYFDPYYYVIYLRVDGNNYVADMIRSTDLNTWEFSPQNPFLRPGDGEGINTSDVDLFEVDGKTRIFYAVGNQSDWCHLREAVFPGPMRELFESCYPSDKPGETFRIK